MTFNGLRFKYALEGPSNFYSWKDRMEAMLDENGVLEYTQTNIPKPEASNAHQLAQSKKDIAKSRRIITEGVRDHVLLNFHGKETPFSMWKNLIDLF